jgi:hypothetical protein
LISDPGYHLGRAHLHYPPKEIATINSLGLFPPHEAPGYLFQLLIHPITLSFIAEIETYFAMLSSVKILIAR